MNKTMLIIRREYLTRVKKKSFILLTLLMPFIFAALIFVPLALSFIKDGSDKTPVVIQSVRVETQGVEYPEPETH